MFDADYGCAGNRWPVVKLGAGSRAEIVLLSDRFFAITTHFNHHTLPCAGDGCALCEFLPARGLFYAACFCTGCVRLLELGGQSSADLEQHAKLLYGGMAVGQVYSLSRKARKSPVRSECIRLEPRATAVPLLSLAAHTMALYKFPPPNPSDDIASYELRCRLIANKRNEYTARQLGASKAG